MSVDLKPLSEQTLVITGATSGIGLATARMAADHGARLVLVARSEDDLEELEAEIERTGGDAVSVAVDVSDPDAPAEIASAAEDAFGGFDTWVNCAAVFLYGTLEETPMEDMREQFDVNVWGLLACSLEAAEHLQDRGGAIVNLGSVVSDRAVPLQGSYSASKHAAKAFTDALRMELAHDDVPVSVTLIKPAAIDTPYPEHAKNYMDEEADLPPPVYAPETVAEAILHAVEHPERGVSVGGASKVTSLLGQFAPGLMDRIMERSYFDLQRTGHAPRLLEENSLDSPSGGLEERGGYEGHVAGRSLYTDLVRHPKLAGAVALGAGLLATALYGRSRSKRERESSKTTSAGDEESRSRDRSSRRAGVQIPLRQD